MTPRRQCWAPGDPWNAQETPGGPKRPPGAPRRPQETISEPSRASDESTRARRHANAPIGAVDKPPVGHGTCKRCADTGAAAPCEHPRQGRRLSLVGQGTCEGMPEFAWGRHASTPLGATGGVRCGARNARGACWNCGGRLETHLRARPGCVACSGLPAVFLSSGRAELEKG